MTYGAWQSTPFHQCCRWSIEPTTRYLILNCDPSPQTGGFARPREIYGKRNQFLMNEIIGMRPCQGLVAMDSRSLPPRHFLCHKQHHSQIAFFHSAQSCPN